MDDCKQKKNKIEEEAVKEAAREFVVDLAKETAKGIGNSIRGFFSW